MIKNINQEFLYLCNLVRDKEKITYGVNEIEYELVLVLKFIQNNKKYWKQINNFMLKIIQGEILYPLEIVIFSMRELQWKEIKDAAIFERAKTNDWRIITAMNKVLAVYEDNWEDYDLYEYYSRK